MSLRRADELFGRTVSTIVNCTACTESAVVETGHMHMTQLTLHQGVRLDDALAALEKGELCLMVSTTWHASMHKLNHSSL